ncbi:MAG: hypothetical protein U9Q81_02725 [Pseudomonadota bacterium]|nr:hypothetical protein [Pseudomonadota bacterium]
MGKLFPAHVAPGRLRITVKRLKGRPELALKMEEHLAPVWGIDRVEIDPATGSCLLLYDSQAVASPEFLDALSQRLAALLPRFDVRKLISRVGMRG